MLELLLAAPPVKHWLALSALLFAVGIYGFLTRRSAVGMLVAMELTLNAGALNFVIFNRFLTPAAFDGKVMSLFVIAIAAAETLVAIAILVMIFRQKRDIDITTLDAMRH